jgi:type IV pilus assembly protein PilX
MSNGRSCIASRQRGAILVITLLFLTLLTLVAVSGITTGTLEERMARNSRDYNLAFQAAEAALRDARADLSGAAGLSTRNPVIIGNASFPASGCSLGLCVMAAPGVTPVWEVDANWTTVGTFVAYGTYTTALALPLSPTPGGVAQLPRYLIEYIGPSGSQSIYRITSRGWGASSTTMVMLQEEVLR